MRSALPNWVYLQFTLLGALQGLPSPPTARGSRRVGIPPVNVEVRTALFHSSPRLPGFRTLGHDATCPGPLCNTRYVRAARPSAFESELTSGPIPVGAELTQTCNVRWPGDSSSHHAHSFWPPKRDDILQAYERLSLVKHPDKGGSVAAFSEITLAYDVLSDYHRRLEYDLEVVSRRERPARAAMRSGGGDSVVANGTDGPVAKLSRGSTEGTNAEATRRAADDSGARKRTSLLQTQARRLRLQFLTLVAVCLVITWWVMYETRPSSAWVAEIVRRRVAKTRGGLDVCGETVRRVGKIFQKAAIEIAQIHLDAKRELNALGHGGREAMERLAKRIAQRRLRAAWMDSTEAVGEGARSFASLWSVEHDEWLLVASLGTVALVLWW